VLQAIVVLTDIYMPDGTDY